MNNTKKNNLRYGCMVPIILVVLAIVGLNIADKVIPSKARRALPSSATDIQEHYSDAGFTGDFTRVLKARLPEQDFLLYAKNLGLTEKYDPSKHDSISSHVGTIVGRVPNWWDDPRDLDNCYFLYTPDKDFMERIKWKNGWVYFLAISW